MTKMTPLSAPARVHTSRLATASAVLLVGVLAGCSGSGDDPTVGTTSAPGTTSSSSSSSSPSSSGTSSSSSSSSPTSSSSSPTGRTLTITVRGKKVTPAPSTVDLAVGKTLTLVVTSDHDDQLHVHGFDVEKVLKAGTPTSVTLTGKEPGVYEVETHEPALRLLKIAVR